MYLLISFRHKTGRYLSERVKREGARTMLSCPTTSSAPPHGENATPATPRTSAPCSRPVHLIITMINWIRTSRLSIKWCHDWGGEELTRGTSTGGGMARTESLSRPDAPSHTCRGYTKSMSLKYEPAAEPLHILWAVGACMLLFFSAKQRSMFKAESRRSALGEKRSNQGRLPRASKLCLRLFPDISLFPETP